MRVSHRLVRVALALPLLYSLYFFAIPETGLLGPDEPRYASIGRQMARSGDWVTPVLWGEPWFEKPPLLYWMIALATHAGLRDETAARLPVACLSVAFLIFYQRMLARLFGQRAAWFASLILATSVGWVSFSQFALPDLPMAAAFSAAMLLAMPWLAAGPPRRLWLAGALLGLAVLAKGLVPVALALPLVWMGRRRWRDLLWPAAVLLVVVLPWHGLATWRHGFGFLDELYYKHHFQRFASGALLHPQPFWFYLPVLPAGLLPWSPLLLLLGARETWRDSQRRFLLVTVVSGFVFFSLAVNKLPGYLLPLAPAVCALAGVRLSEVKKPQWLLASCALPLALVPAAIDILPRAILEGLTGAGWPSFHPPLAALALLPAAWAAFWDRRGRRGLALAGVAGAMWVSVLAIKVETYPVLDEKVSVRRLWRRVAGQAPALCAEEIGRSALYGLNYYAGKALPPCGGKPGEVPLRGRE